jgi:hypothetical protein
VGVTDVPQRGHQPLAEFLVRRFADVMIMAVDAVGGLLAGPETKECHDEIASFFDQHLGR